MGKVTSASSTNPDRKAEKGGQRSKATIMRLNMYKNGKPIRNKLGEKVGGSFCLSTTAGGQKIVPGQQGRIAPDRRWFGNTRIISQTELDQFREKVTQTKNDPYSVLLRRKKIPMALLKDAADSAAASEGNLNVAPTTEGYMAAFGSKSTRKRPKIAATSYESLMEHVSNAQSQAGASTEPADGESDNEDKTKSIKDDMFAKGQSKRIWGELYKVLDCSDVVLQIVDARNVPGTRCYHVERHIKQHASHKHLITIINKCDLVPAWCTRKWVAELSKEFPTLAFHAASNNKPFGKGALITLLRQFGKLHANKRQISVGIIGYPNTGKSSVINTLTSSRACVTAPVPGQTKVWQYVALTNRIHLIDSPGIVYDGEEHSDEDTVLKGVVRAERLRSPQDFVPAILEKVQTKHINKHYGINYEGFVPSGDRSQDAEEAARFLRLVALKQGKLLAGGEGDVNSVAKIVINDFQRGKLPYFIAPPLSEDAEHNDAGDDEEEGEGVVEEEEEGEEEEEEAEEEEDEEEGSDDQDMLEDDEEEEAEEE